MHTVYRLDIHLPAEQCVYFQNNLDQQSLKQELKRDYVNRMVNTKLIGFRSKSSKLFGYAL